MNIIELIDQYVSLPFPSSVHIALFSSHCCNILLHVT